MTIPCSIQTFHFAGTDVYAFVPSAEWLQEQNKKIQLTAPPYWAQVWPAAIALCEVIAEDTSLVKNQTVLELAAGLGLPSLLAAQFATQVTASDIAVNAVEIMKLSAQYNKLQNMKCCEMSWSEPGISPQPDVLLVSDINYEPQSFNELYKTITGFINKGTTVLLSTPQRLVAKTFMEQLQPWCKNTIEKEVQHNDETVFITVWFLRK